MQKKKRTNKKHLNLFSIVWFRFMVFNATLKTHSVISWLSGLLVEETTDMSQFADICYSIMYRVHLAMNGIRTDNFSGDGLFIIVAPFHMWSFC